MKTRLLIVDEDPLSSLELQVELEKNGCEVVTRIPNAAYLLGVSEKYPIDVIIIDLKTIDELESWEAALALRQNMFKTPILLLYDKRFNRPFEISHSTFLSKPVSIASIVECIDKFDRFCN